MSRFDHAPAKSANSIDASTITTNLACNTNMQTSNRHQAPNPLRHGLLKALALGLAASTLAGGLLTPNVQASAAAQSDADLAKISAATRYILGLPLAGLTQTAGSDSESKSFLTDVLPSISKLLNEKLGETKPVQDASLFLDPSKLNLATDSDVRVYFVGEGAGYHNSLGYQTVDGKVTPEFGKLIFPDASSSISTYTTSASGIKRTSSEPLLPGDFVDLGTFKGGTQFDFFLVADGANKGKTVYTTEVAANPDKINHVVAFALAGSPYLIMGFEDLYGGGDKDFNDVLFAVNIGVKNVMALTGTPEPSTWLVLGTFLGLVYWYQSRRKPVTA